MGHDQLSSFISFDELLDSIIEAIEQTENLE